LVVSGFEIVVLGLMFVASRERRICLRYGGGLLGGGEWMGLVRGDWVGQSGSVWIYWRPCRVSEEWNASLREAEGRGVLRGKSGDVEIQPLVVVMWLVGQLRL